MAIVDDYKQIVLSSKLLNPYQRDAMLDGVEEMPEEYLEAMTEILGQFDERSWRREKALEEKITKAFGRYEETILNLAHLDTTRKEKLLAQAQSLKNVLIFNV